jgi:hypothetical protein
LPPLGASAGASLPTGFADGFENADFGTGSVSRPCGSRKPSCPFVCTGQVFLWPCPYV